MSEQYVLRIITRMLVPPILLFGLYVQMHGHYGPGGGFQAGVIFAAGFILYELVFGTPARRHVVPLFALASVACLGVLLYTGVGVASMVGGGKFLDYGALASTASDGQYTGIVIIEIAVGITVAAVMLVVFYAFYAASERR